MGGNNKLPIDLVIARGKKNLTKAEIETRRAQELKVEFKDVKPPEYLPAKLKDTFEDIAKKLVTIGVMTELDEDCLARYLISHDSYLRYNKMLSKAMRAGDVNEIAKVQRIQDIAFKQCFQAATALGLTISSRCKLVVPIVEADEKPKNKFGRFIG